MLEEQIIPRLLARAGAPTAIFLKRFHSYGLGESHVDQLLTGIEDMVPDGSVKLGFRAHYPQIETKLTARGRDAADIQAKLGPVEAEVRKRLGNFILAEGDQTLFERLHADCADATVTQAVSGDGVGNRTQSAGGAIHLGVRCNAILRHGIFHMRAR